MALEIIFTDVVFFHFRHYFYEMNFPVRILIDRQTDRHT